MTNSFFTNKGPFKIYEILKHIGLNILDLEDKEIFDVKDLYNSSDKDITF